MMLSISINGHAGADRVQEPCDKCHGEGEYWRATASYKMEHVSDFAHPSDRTEEVLKHRESCDACNGVGWVLPKDGDRVEVYRRDELIGTCTVPAKLRPHIFVDQRPGDFVPKLRNGKMIYQMANSLCPGDWELLGGYQRYIRDESK